uniref:glutathione transferase n=1 Tax=Ciona savignyi TaxID=51511 RepID=H2YFI1_CIOSA
MSKTVLHYLDGRGRAEKIRWMLAACGIDYDENFSHGKEDFQKRVDDGLFLFKQIPMLEIDGIKIVQTGAILRYLGHKGKLMGDNPKEGAMIDMYTDGLIDMSVPGMIYIFQPKDEIDAFWTTNKEKLNNKYFQVFEKILETNQSTFLVGNRQSMADIILIETLVNYIDIEQDILANYPNLTAFMKQQGTIPWVSKFMQPGSKRKPFPGAKYAATVQEIFF